MKELHPTAIVRSAADLRIMAAEVKSELKQGDEAGTKRVKHYYIAGQMLLKAKERLGHGMFEQWLKDHFQQTTRTLRRWMQLSKRTLASVLEEEWARINGHDPESEDEKDKGDNSNGECEKDEESDSGSTDSDGECDQKGHSEGGGDDGQSGQVLSESESFGDADETEVKDAEGAIVPEAARPAFLQVDAFRAVAKALDDARRAIKEICEGPAGRLIQFEDVSQHISNAKRGVLQSRPTHVCPLCSGQSSACQCCKGRGWTVEHVYKRITAEKNQ